MKKHILIIVILCTAFAIESEAQFRYHYYYGRPRVRSRVRVAPAPRRPQTRQTAPKKAPFEPTLNLSIGYGFPNLDKDHLYNFYNSYRGNSSQTGPITGAIDYQFNRNMSIGVIGTYGKVSAPYYNYSNSTNIPDFTGKLENWSVMLNIMTYFPTYNRKVEPYLRTAIGVNNWKQDYIDETGAKVYDLENPTILAYQASLGARFNISKNAGLYIEGGYGKYILNGGLTLKF
ncbi:porin family protein [Panacibacter ginsenosidivorans]|uniref:Porin family protein n=1 Tax=Panacibacter ginsenosidivorans TaxID=1813871 RepID=A0A5B8VES1_9BACT|nr:outer membrane beta-barrel protein [Panacibacter ginsenosidivorans]QEC69799.1 porin family protein [Panacibacter ginsenosidivorans]